MSTTLDQIRQRLNPEGKQPTNPCDEIPVREPLTGDAKLRAENPGLQELWDQYQTMLKLIKPAKVPNQEPSAADLLGQIRSRKATPTPKFKPRELIGQLEKFMEAQKDNE